MEIYKCKLNGKFYIVIDKYDNGEYVKAMDIEDRYNYTIPIKELILWITKDELKRK